MATSFRSAAKAVSLLVLALATPSDAGTFYSALSNCPAPCVASSQPNSWTSYDSPKDLRWCNETMAVDFSLHNSLDDTTTHQVVRACTITTTPRAVKKLAASGVKTYTAKSELQLISGGDSANASALIEKDDILDAIKHLQDYLGNGNGNAPIAFSYSRTAAVGVYLGNGIQHQDAASSLIEKVADNVQSEAVGGKSLLQLCGSGRDSDSVFGIVVDSVENLASIQKAVKTWSEAKCFTEHDGTESRLSVDVLMTAPPITATNEALPSEVAHGDSRRRALRARANCRTIQVVAGDGCESLATKCGITGNAFTSYNPSSTLCSTLQEGQYVCCSTGTLPDRTPKPQADGTCASYIVQSGDYCAKIAAANSLTVDKIESFNKKTWGWTGCDNLLLGIKMCLSTGNAPLPAPLTNAICGPQVPGTTKPASGVNLADLNPCPLNACCNIWGQCGTTTEFCTPSMSKTGAPGTAAPEQNGCISNCGTNIVNNGSPPSSFINLAYFEAWNSDRSCLQMDVTEVGPGYTNIHFAFATITADFKVDVSQVQAQFDKFTKMSTSAKRILSFGGWSFSTDVDSYPIFRNTVTAANRDLFAANVVKFVNNHGLDGVDFGWEYPGAPDIPGIPPGSPEDGVNYVYFLQSVKDKLASGKSLSIAAPASFWYLKGFPIKDISGIVDYIVFMTYDLHGQWDYGSKWSNPGCDTGNCLRSHINGTETINALSMITKAGVPASKIVTGIASYGRSFQMTTAGCTGPMCTFTGPDSGAHPGLCTSTAGYISHAEIKDIIRTGGSAVKTWFDDGSQSNMMVYNDMQWVAYMDDDTKAKRTTFYKALNLGGTTDWAVDLAEFKSAAQCPSSSPDCYAGPPPPPADLDWRKVTCTDPWIVDASQNQTDRWNGVGAPQAWADAVDYWVKSTKPNPGNLNFTGQISNFFHLAEGIRCENTIDNNGCTGPFECKTTEDTGAASYLVLGSITAVESGILNLFDGITRAEADITTMVSEFISDFAPIPPTDNGLKIALDLVSLGFSLAASPVWSTWLKPAFKNNPNALATIKDWVNPIVTNSITLIKDGMVAGAILERQNDLSTTLGKVARAWYSTIDQLNQHLFSGDQYWIDQLTSMISDGKMVGRPTPLSALDVVAYVEQAFFSVLLPHGWALGGTAVFVLDSGYACGTVDPDITFFNTARDGVNAWSCVDDKLYYLAGLSGNAKVCADTCMPANFKRAPGVEKLDGSHWGGITVEDVIVGAINGYKANGNLNGGPPADPSDSQSLSDLFDFGTRAPGVMRVPVCRSEVAHAQWSAASDVTGALPPYPWPCGGFVGCYNVHKSPDWMTYEQFTSGIGQACDQMKGQVVDPDSSISRSITGLKLEDGRDGVYVGEIKNTGQDPYTVDYNYCMQSMAAVRDQCHGDGEETYGGEWHDTIWVVADTNAA